MQISLLVCGKKHILSRSLRYAVIFNKNRETKKNKSLRKIIIDCMITTGVTIIAIYKSKTIHSVR